MRERVQKFATFPGFGIKEAELPQSHYFCGTFWIEKTHIFGMANSMKTHIVATSAAKKRVAAAKKKSKISKMNAKSKMSMKSAASKKSAANNSKTSPAKGTKTTKAMQAAKAINMRAKKAKSASKKNMH